MRLLARREHAASELERKLGQRGWPGDEIVSIIAELDSEGLQSDSRFAESFARQRAERHYGPMRIRSELRQRGLDAALIEQALDALDVDFQALAREFYQRRYGRRGGAPDHCQDYRERARRYQAMSRRGFDSEHLRGIDRDADDDDVD